jgi:hypothetical protein
MENGEDDLGQNSPGRILPARDSSKSETCGSLSGD